MSIRLCGIGDLFQTEAHHKRAARRQSGFALLTTIWAIVVISLIAVAIISITRSHVTGIAISERSARLEAAADAGFYLAVDHLLKDARNRESLKYPLNGDPVSEEFANIRLVVSVQDAGGRIDLNTSRPELLVAAFQGLGADRDLAARLSDQLLDWRDADLRPTGTGGELATYQQLRRAYGPKNGPFVSVNELAQLPDFDPIWIPAFNQIATVHSGLAGLDPRHMRPELKILLGFSSDANPTDLLETGNRNLFASSNAGAFIVKIQAYENQAVFVRQAVVRLNPTSSPPFDILEWKRGMPFSTIAEEDVDG